MEIEDYTKINGKEVSEFTINDILRLIKEERKQWNYYVELGGDTSSGRAVGSQYITSQIQKCNSNLAKLYKILDIVAGAKQCGT